MSSDLSSLPPIIVGRARWVRGIGLYLQQSLGAPPVTAHTSTYILSALSCGQHQPHWPHLIPPGSSLFLLKRDEQKSFHLVETTVLEPFSLEERVQLPGLRDALMREDEMCCLPSPSQGSVLITDSPVLSSAWNSVSLALGIF